MDACLLCYNGYYDHNNQKKKKQQRKPNPRYVYDYVQEEYWPTGIHNFCFVILNQKYERHLHFYEYYEEQYYKNNKKHHRQILFYLNCVIWQPFWDECQYLGYYYTWRLDLRS